MTERFMVLTFSWLLLNTMAIQMSLSSITANHNHFGVQRPEITGVSQSALLFVLAFFRLTKRHQSRPKDGSNSKFASSQVQIKHPEVSSVRGFYQQCIRRWLVWTWVVKFAILSLICTHSANTTATIITVISCHWSVYRHTWIYDH